jgi:hypothetical protein
MVIDRIPADAMILQKAIPRDSWLKDSLLRFPTTETPRTIIKKDKTTKPDSCPS